MLPATASHKPVNSQPGWDMVEPLASLFPIVDAGDYPSHPHLAADSPSTLLLLRIGQSGQQQQRLWPLAGTKRVKAGRKAWRKSWMGQKTAGKYFINTGSQTETHGSSLLYKSISSGYINHKSFWKRSNFKSK